MKIAVIQATTQTGKNQLLFDETARIAAAKGWEAVNLGVYAEEENFSYIQISLCVGLLINSGAADFVVTGCSSGNGMAIACNALPNLIAGYLPAPADAYLFGRINRGNVASLSLGLNFGWAGEINLRQTLTALFEEPMNTGYPAEAAARKQADALKLTEIKSLSQTDMMTIFSGLEEEFIRPIFQKSDLVNYLLKNGKNKELLGFLEEKSNMYGALKTV